MESSAMSHGTDKKFIDMEAFNTARKICAAHDIGFAEAYRITSAIWDEARRAILAALDKEDWQKLTFSERSFVCQTVVRALLDRKKTLGFLSGATKTLL